MRRYLAVLTAFFVLVSVANGVSALSCDNGNLSSSECVITEGKDITGETITTSNTDIVVKSSGALFTNHKTDSNSPQAYIRLNDGQFIVESEGVVHANINVSAKNIVVEDGAVIDATGLGWQASRKSTSDCPAGVSEFGYCLGRGPAGGAGGDGNSNTGAAGGGHGGKGGSYIYTETNYDASGGGRGNVNNRTYGNATNPVRYGSAGGSEGSNTKNTLTDVDGKHGHNDLSSFEDSDLRRLVKAATDDSNQRDDPDNDRADSDRWHGSGDEYRLNNPHDIYMSSGGGIITLSAAKEIVINGSVLSNGLDGSDSSGSGVMGGGGAGGSIRMSAGGMFGDGFVQAEGGDYAEWIDGGGGNSPASGVSAGGGGGRIFYEYSIEEQNWSISAAAGVGNVNSSVGFGGSENKVSDTTVFATDGTVRDDIAFSARVNETIVNDNEDIFINGTASTNVSISLNGTKQGADAVPNQSDGFYSKTITALDIQDFDQYQDYKLRISSEISDGRGINETFNLSHEAYQVQTRSDYVLRPEQTFNVSVNLTHHQPGSDGSHTPNSNVTGQTVRYSRDGATNLTDLSDQTVSGGLVSFQDTLNPTVNRQSYSLRTTDDDGIRGSSTKNIAWVDINDTIVDPGQTIKINGTAHNTVKIYYENRTGQLENIQTISDTSSSGFYNTTIQTHRIQNISNLGNYTLEVRTELNGDIRTERFQVYHRELEILNNPEYLHRPNETFTVSNRSIIYKENGSDDVTTQPYTGNITLAFKNESATKDLNTIQPNDTTGRFAFNKTVSPTREKKRYTLSATTENGVNDIPSDDDIFSTNNQSYGWVTIDESILKPGETITVNGSAHNDITISLGNQTVIANLTPDSTTGYFEHSFSVPAYTDVSKLGNQTLTVETPLNGETRTEDFSVSIRDLRYSLDSTYPRQVNPDETFSVSGTITKYRENTEGGSKVVNYSNQLITATYQDTSGFKQTVTNQTNSTGSFNIRGLTSPSNGGDRTVQISTTSEGGVTRERNQQVNTRIRLANGSAVSPANRQFKDSSLRETATANRGQNMTFRVKTRKSLNFVDDVYADITAPDDSQYNVSLEPQNVLGETISGEDLSSTSKTNITDKLPDISRARMSLGYQADDEAELLLSLPFNNDDPFQDVSPTNQPIATNGDVSRSPGVYSTQGISLEGGSIEIPDTQALNFASNFTISTWIQTNQNQSGVIYSRADYASDNIGPQLRITDNGKLRFTASAPTQPFRSPNTIDSNTTLDDGEWHHIMATYDHANEEVSLFIDGELENTAGLDDKLQTFSTAPKIGGAQRDSFQGFQGNIDQFRIFNETRYTDTAEDLSTTTGTLSTTVTTEEPIIDTLKLINFDGQLNQGNLSFTVESDPDKDGIYESTSPVIPWSNTTAIQTVTGLPNKSSSYRITTKISTTSPSRSPEVSGIDVKARNDDVLLWEGQTSIANLSDQFGSYQTKFKANDLSGNPEDTTPQTSSFTVQDLNITADHTSLIEPGTRFNISGNSTLIAGDGSGGPDPQAYNDDISILFDDTINGSKTVSESVRLSSLQDGSQRIIPVNGTLAPQNTTVTFIGAFSGVDEILRWGTASDWDEGSRTGTTHSNKRDSRAGNNTVTVGYPAEGLQGNTLQSYYPLDDQSYPLDDTSGSDDLNASGNPQLNASGILSTRAVRFDGASGFQASDSPMTSSNTFTINAWVNPSEQATGQGGLGSDAGDAQTIFALNDSLTLQVAHNGSAFAAAKVEGTTYEASTAAETIPTNEWTMITLRYDGSTLFVSKGGIDIGDTLGKVDLPSNPILSGRSSFVGYRPDLQTNGFTGRIDELRIYNGVVGPGFLRDTVGEPQQISLNSKAFNESVDADSLRLKSKIRTNGQNVTATVRDGVSASSDPIKLSDDTLEYSVPGTLSNTQSYSVDLTLESNITHAPTIYDVELVRQFASDRPSIDIDGDGSSEANVSGRLPDGNTATFNVAGLTLGNNNVSFSLSNGIVDARINYTEVLANDSTPPITPSQGSFTTSFITPNKSQQLPVEYFTTSSNGILGNTETTVNVSLLFTEVNITDTNNITRTLDPSSNFSINAALLNHKNPITRVWAIIKTPNENYTRNLSKSNGSWGFQAPVSSIYDGDGQYNATLRAVDAKGIPVKNPPSLRFNITNGTASIRTQPSTVGINRSFNVNGTVRQALSGDPVNATANVELPQTGQEKNVSVSNGTYETALTAPGSSGTYNVSVTTIDTDSITAFNRTTITVQNSTNLTVRVPDERVSIRGVTSTSGKNKSIPINITNRGETQIRNLTVFAEDLPQASNPGIFESLGGRDWESVNQSYDIPANTTRNVTAIIDVSQASDSGRDFPLNISTTFETSGGTRRETTSRIVTNISTTKIPLFQGNATATFEDGYQGNLLPPNSSANLTIINEGTGLAQGVGWNITNNRFKQAWITGFFSERVKPTRSLSTGDPAEIFEMTGGIPEGTPPGNYTTNLETFSNDAFRTNNATVTITVKDSPKWTYSLSSLREEVVIPDTVNQTNPIDIGVIELNNVENALNISLNNTGNRNLTWSVETGIVQDPAEIISVDRKPTDIPQDYEDETYKSNITEKANYTYDIPTARSTIGYDTQNVDSLPSTYQANITIQCDNPPSCQPNEVTLPITGEIKDPAPRVKQVSIPNITGRGNPVSIEGKVEDNTNNTPTDGVAGLNITITKYLNQTVTETLVAGEDFSIQEPQGDFSYTFTPTKLGRDLPANDHTYSIRFEAVDNKGTTRTTKAYNLTVRDKATNVDLSLNRTGGVTLDDVNATSGDTASITGTIQGGEVDVSDVSVVLGVNDATAGGSPDNVNFTETSLPSLGNLPRRSNISFTTEITSSKNLDFVPDYTGDITPAWTNPDGTNVSGEGTSVVISASPNRELRIEGPDQITVPHGTTTSTNITLESTGNADVEDISLSCDGCSEELGITGYSETDFDVAGGDTVRITFNTTSEQGKKTTSEAISITAEGNEAQATLNTTLFIPRERSVSLSPENASVIFPADQGQVPVTNLTIENTGNVNLKPLTIENPQSFRFYIGQDDAEPYKANLAPGEVDTVKAIANSDQLAARDSSAYNYTEEGNLNPINPNASTFLDEFNTVDVKLFVQNISFETTSLSPTDNITLDDTISAQFNLTEDGVPLDSSSDAAFSVRSGDEQTSIDATYDNTEGVWDATFNPLNLTDGTKHDYTFAATSSSFLSSISTQREVSYKDVTPPIFTNLTAQDVRQSQTSNVSVIVKDKSALSDGVKAQIQTPGGSNITRNLTKTISGSLKDVPSATYKFDFTQTNENGLYNLSVKATDESGNTGSSEPVFIRVFQPVDIEGDAGEPSPQTKIDLVSSSGQVSETVQPNLSDNTYDETIKSGNYSQAEIQVDPDKQVVLSGITAEEINSTPPRFESNIPESRVRIDEKYLKGFAIEADALQGQNGTVAFRYRDHIDEIGFEGNLQVMKCAQYNLSAANPCQSNYTALPSNRTGIDPQSKIIVADGIQSFSSYIVVENTSSSEDDESLNLNLSGEIGDLSNLSGLQDTLSEVASNTGALSEVASNTDDLADSGGGGGGAGGGGASFENASDTLDDIASELNETKNETNTEGQDLTVGNSEINVNIQPGETTSTAVSVQNTRNEEDDISLTVTDNLEELVRFDSTVTLEPGEFRTIPITVNATNQSDLTQYTGFLRIAGEEVERSIPFSINLVTPDQRLLDVSLEPTVDTFQPGETARLKLSFNNQGFSRAVDAKTSVQIVDVADGDVVQRTTKTYAVQTTLDKIVTLEIPEDTELGTYEARASVEYSNIADNRSATAVGQVSVQRPFLNQETLGVSNSNILLGLTIALTVGLAAGYWYYRRQRLKAKRKRFEEQVDNDALPKDTGRSAFVGKLSEIGTRSFINLNDLMTHCLTAGATGAGKSVAAQVIVEEALEQGVNVIVLDPTGQWSGYLDENNDNEFLAFFEDFGMQEKDARSYEGNIRAVESDQDTIDITDVYRPEGDEGSIHVFSMHKLNNLDLEEYLSDTIQQIFDYNPEEKDHLETLIVYDEAHRVLEKFGGTGRGAKMLERGAREFRKWGTGMLVISQVIEDFPEEVRANIGTQIQMRTEYEGDLDRIERKYGNHITQGVTKAGTGTGMIQNSSYNHGRPYFVDFRPIKHSPERLSDDQLDKFEKYNRRLDEIQDIIEILEDQGEDVFEYKSQLQLVKKNIRKKSFNLVETYIEELEEDLDDAV